jgi:hypothetical protein
VIIMSELPDTQLPWYRHLRRRSLPELVNPPLEHRDFPHLQRAGETASATSQRWFTRSTKATLALTLLAAIFGAVERAWAGWAAAAAFAIALLLGLLALGRDVEARWYDARSLAETVKSMSWKYAVGCSEYPLVGPDAATATGQFEQRLTELLPILDKLGTLPPSSPAGNGVKTLRAKPLDARRDAYLVGRVQDQLDWYTLRALHHRAWALVWQSLAALLQVAGIAGAVAKGLELTSVDWLGIAAAAAAASAAWLRTKDHVTVSRAYAVTAHELALAKTLAPSFADGDPAAETDWATFVDDTEQAISREHNLWLGRRRTRSDS